MISFSTAEINAWIVAFFFPLTRVLAVLATAPPFNNPALTVRIRLAFGLAITVALAPALPRMPPVDPASAAGLLMLAQEVLIGTAMGFTLRLVLGAVDMAGNLISLEMGIGFASAYDPQTAGQTVVVSEFLGLLALLVFFAINGHLMVIATVSQSFVAIPIGATALTAGSWSNVAHFGSVVFAAGLFLALPILIALLISNLALAILSRAAPQLNLIAIGFPLTIALGFASLIVGLSYLADPLQQWFEHGLQGMLGNFALRPA